MHNVGSVFRTSDGVGSVEKIYLSGITPSPIDKYGRERSAISKVSLGAEKNIPWEKIGEEEYSENTWEAETTTTTTELIESLKKDRFTVYAIEQHESSIPHTSVSLSDSQLEKTALLVGHEREGIPESILKHCDHILEIPMKGEKNSLNVSVAYGVVAYSLSG